MGDEDTKDREVILGRRRRFVQLAIAGLAAGTVACGGDDDAPPVPCLDAPCLPEDGCGPVDAGPPPGVDAGTDAGTIVIRDAGDEDGGTAADGG